MVEVDKKEKFMGTVGFIYRDILNYQNSLNVRGFTSAGQEIDLGEARFLVDFLKSGVYIEDSRISEKAKTLVGMYSLQNKMEDLVSLFGVSRASIYKYSRVVERSLSLVFPQGLKELWSKRDYKAIRECIEIYQKATMGDNPLLEKYVSTFDLTKQVKVGGRVPIDLLQQLRVGTNLEEIEDSLVDIRSFNYFLDKILEDENTLKVLQALRVCYDKGLYISPEVQSVLE